MLLDYLSIDKTLGTKAYIYYINPSIIFRFANQMIMIVLEALKSRPEQVTVLAAIKFTLSLMPIMKIESI